LNNAERIHVNATNNIRYAGQMEDQIKELTRQVGNLRERREERQQLIREQTATIVEQEKKVKDLREQRDLLLDHTRERNELITEQEKTIKELRRKLSLIAPEAPRERKRREAYDMIRNTILATEN